MTRVEIDSKTGLPELPEGYFWRVGNFRFRDMYRYTSTEFGIALMRYKRGWFKVSAKVYDKRSSSPAMIAECALDMAKYLHAAIKLDAQKAKMTGDYPPKRLEA